MARLPTPLKFMMPGWYALVMGLAGLSLAWHRAVPLLGEMAGAVALLVGALAAAVFAVLAVATVIRGQRYPVVGRVCMDQLMVNIEWETAYNGDEVILIGEAEDGASITVEELAEWAGTIPWEILTNVNTRVPRVYRRGAGTDSPQTSVD